MNIKVRISSIILSFFLFFFSVCNCTLNVSAFPKFDWSDMSWKEATWEEAEGEIMATFGYIATSLSTVYSGDFSQFVANYYDFKSLWDDSGWLKEQISVDSNDNSITFSEDLTAYMKQALTEYAQEANGFLIYPTTNYLSVPPSNFLNSYAYRTFCALVKENGCIVVNTNNIDSDTLYVARPFDDITKDSISLVVKSNYSNYLIVGAGFYGTNTWELYSTQSKIFRTVSYDTDYVAHYQEFHHWDEGTDYSEGVYSMPYTGLLDMRGKYPLGSVRGWTFFSDDGRRLRVFKSLNDLKNYTTGNRSVYFGSGFYDDIGEIKVSFDDLEKYINTDSDKLFDKLKDLIGENEGNLTEEDLEKLVDKILNASDGSGGSGSGPGSDSTPSSIIGWLEKIYDKLADMLQQLKSIKRWTVIDTVINGVDAVADWLDLIHDIISDADDGMESAVSTLSSALDDSAGLLKKKFPFSVPWDILAFVTLFAAEPEVPRFEVPIDIGVSAVGLDIHYDFVVDFSDYQYLSDIFRAVLSLTYAVGLIKMTAGIASTKKEE